MFRAPPMRALLGLTACHVFRSPKLVKAEFRVDETTGESSTAESKNATAAAYSKTKLFRRDPFTVERSRKVCVLIGMTGVGKVQQLTLYVVPNVHLKLVPQLYL